jgi:hypothetical protein
MRLHEYIKSLDVKNRYKFEIWKNKNNQKIYRLKKQLITEKNNPVQQQQFEQAIIKLHQYHTGLKQRV